MPTASRVQLPRRLAANDAGSGRRLSIFRRSRRALNARDITVPIGSSHLWATSRDENPFDVDQDQHLTKPSRKTIEGLRQTLVVDHAHLLERLFLEERRRTKIIPHAFGERPVLKLMYAAVIRAADRWRGITVGKFEQRQPRAIRDELNRAHATRTAPAVTAPKPAAVRKLRS